MKLPNKKYNIIYADPPWQWKTYSKKGILSGWAEKNYPLMNTEDICNLPIKDITDNQVKVTASIQSFVKDLGGSDYADASFDIDETIAILYVQSSGVLRIRAANIRNLTTRSELRTKIVLDVHLKKAGFQNTDQSATGAQVTGLLTAV